MFNGLNDNSSSKENSNNLLCFHNIKVEVIPTKARSIGRISWEYTVVKVLYAL